MENGYNISIKEECDGALVRVYLEPQCEHKSHRKLVGYIDNYTTFKCTNNELMTLEIMEAIVSAWKIMMHDLEES